MTAALEHSDCKLKSLTHNYTLTDNAAKYYAAALMHSNCKLESLNLSFNKFTDNAAKDFAAALKHSNCKLESLVVKSSNNLATGSTYTPVSYTHLTLPTKLEV